MNKEIIIITHETFSKGIYNALSLIIGKQENFHIITAYIDENLDFKKQLKDLIDKLYGKEIIICTDIFGGSVNNEVMNYIKNKNIHLITGINLTLLINLATSDISDSKLLIKSSIKEAKEAIIYCNELIKDVLDEDF